MAEDTGEWDVCENCGEEVHFYMRSESVICDDCRRRIRQNYEETGVA